MYIKKTKLKNMSIPLGETYFIVNKKGKTVDEYAMITPFKSYGYYGKKLKNKLNRGSINQKVYDESLGYKGKASKALLIESNVQISKDSLVALVYKYNIADINTKSKVVDILTQLNKKGYQVIKNK